MKFIFYGLLTCLLVGTQVNVTNSAVPGSDLKKEETVLRVKTISGSITLSGGCHVKYTITVDYDIVPPRVNSIHGTVTMSGPCSGTQTFSARATLNGGNQFTSIETTLTGMLQSPELNGAMLESLNAANLFAEE